MVSGPSSSTSRDSYHDAPQDTESQLAKLVQEERVGLMNYLLTKAVVDDQPLPVTSSPREITFWDILCMLSELQKEWKKACHKELESLVNGMSSRASNTYLLMLAYSSVNTATALLPL